MNNYTRFLLASFSALLLAAGLSRAAEKIDPLSNSTTSHDLKLTEGDILAANSCQPCAACADDDGGGDFGGGE